MANPQKENGYTALANEIVDRLCRFRISGEEWQVLWVVLRKTYGWSKIEDAISLTQFQETTGLNRSSVARAIRKVVSKKILCSIKSATGESTTYYFQKDYEKWMVVAKKPPSDKKETKGSGNFAQKVVAILPHTKTTIQKQIKTIPIVSPTKIVQDFFYSKYQETFEDAYVADFGKDGAIFKGLLKALSVERIKDLIISFFQSHDAFIKNAGYTVGVFRSQVNKLKNPINSNEEELRKAGLFNDSTQRTMAKREYFQR